MRCRAALLALCFAVANAWCAEPSPAKQTGRLLTLKGDVLQGEVDTLTDKEIGIKDNGKTTTTAVEQVLKLDFPSVTAAKLEGKFSDVELTDGTRFHCKEWTIKRKQLEATTLAGQALKLPITAVSSILNDAQEDKYRKDWSQRLTRQRRRDVAVLLKDGTINPIEGTAGEADAEGKYIEFQVGSAKGNFYFNRLHGLMFQRTLDPKAPPLVCKLYDRFGDYVMVSAVAKNGEALTVTTPAGAKIDVDLKIITRLDYTLDKLAFLSELEPSKVVETSNFDFVDTYRRDKNLDNGPLRIYNETFNVGLALHAHTELEYNLRGDYREFHALAGIDQSVGGVGGPVVLQIIGVIDGEEKELYKKTFTRKDSRNRGDGKIDLNIKDVQKLRIVVRSGDAFDTGKHLDLVEAKVQK